MKRSFIFLLASICIASAEAQETGKKGITEITFGVMVPVTGTYNFKKDPPLQENPFQSSVGKWVVVAMSSEKMYATAIYSIDENSMKSQDGYILPDDWNTYIFGSYGLNKSNERYLGVGGEKSLYFGKKKNLEITFFLEAGYNMTETQKYPSATLGTVIYPKLFLLRK